MPSIWSAPNPILFGFGVSAQAGEELKKLGCKKALVVFDKGVAAAGIPARIIKSLNESGIDAVP
ncbi:MAG: iron-containing alcohol dehydrogenase, partial [Oscillospiraceae bacterium]|nr:iron-containing alcohol dehydrogenase [Oscillospiraceae bacterium]